jgi:hypothetical protein
MSHLLSHFPLLLAQAAGEAAVKTTYRFAKLQSLDDERWRYALLAAICVAILGFVIWMYRRDASELARPIAWLLVSLRLGAFLAALFFYLGLEKRTEKEVVHNSRVLVLVDTSQSMAQHDDETSGVPATPSRMDLVVKALSEGELLAEIRKTHDVVVTGFDRDPSALATLKKFSSQGNPTTPEDATKQGDATQGDKPIAEETDWKQLLLPAGNQTALGKALKRLLDEEQANPVSAVIVITDGAQNAGLEPARAIDAAKDAEIPIFTIGLGSDRRPVNVRISDVIAPQRAFPGDSFHVTGYIQAQGLSGRTVTVELYSKDSANDESAGLLEDSQRVTLGPDGEVLPVKFELSSEEPARRTYRLAVVPPRDDRNASDNYQEFDVDVVDQENRVLLFASGASREYRFLRNQLRRDDSVVVDVLLQSARPGISQDANEILDDFPITKEEMFQYDAIVAFDPDWTALSAEQIDLLETWVAEKAGGLIAIAGPIHTATWASQASMTKIRNLYPVQFQRRLTLDDSDFGSKEPWPIDFTREGTEAEFLWLDDDAVQSQVAWVAFSGVYGHYAVKGAKPGATVYGRFSDPESGLGDDLPAYFAEHLYGSGRVFYMGSGEMWRLRAEDVAYFEKLYTKLIRHVSQGRLLRGSSRGVLLVERDRYQLGDTVVVRAQLYDANQDPIQADSVTLQVVRPDTTTEAVTLKADKQRPGQFNGQFTVLQERGYQLVLPIPETIDEQLPPRRIQVGGILDLEQKNPQRNDALLSEIAARTGGLYYVGFDAVTGQGGTPPLVAQLRDVRETTILAGSPDKEFDKMQMEWLLGVICGLLCLEWLIRRLSKLA